MLKVCKNNNCNKEFSFTRITKQYCSNSCRYSYLNLTRKEEVKKWSLKNKEHLTKKRKEYYIANKSRIDLMNKLYSLKNKDRLGEVRFSYYLKNKSKIVANVRKWRKENKNMVKFYRSNERMAKLTATPKFANLIKIKEIYKNCPKGYHVDHIIPLRGKTVCGLHVEWNLQYLTPTENCRKSNKIIL